MRTTITFREDVAQALRRLRKERGVGNSELVNELLRAALRELDAPRERPPFRQEATAMHARVDVTDVAGLLDDLDGPQRP